MIHAAGHINMRMPHYMVIKISTALNSVKKAINGSKILFLGVAYKPNIDDARESPALEIIDMVAKKGGEVSYYDPYIPEVITPKGRFFQSINHSVLQSGNQSFSSADSGSILQSFNCIVITTNHQVFDAEVIQKHAKLIVDLRNVMKVESNTIFSL